MSIRFHQVRLKTPNGRSHTKQRRLEVQEVTTQIFSERSKRPDYTVVSVDGAAPRKRGDLVYGCAGVVIWEDGEPLTDSLLYTHPQITSVWAEALAFLNGLRVICERDWRPTTIICGDNKFVAELFAGRQQSCAAPWWEAMQAEARILVNQVSRNSELWVVAIDREFNGVADKASKLAFEDLSTAIHL